VSHLAYIAVLALCLLGTGWLELAMRTRVYRRWVRLVFSVLPTVVVFTLWDVYAINQGHWSFDANLTTGIILPGQVPLDEVLFFIAIPICAILTLEAVRSATGLPAGDEVGDSQLDPPS